MKEIECHKCPEKHSCCQEGVWVDLKEAKKILSLRLRGEFYYLEQDKDFPSGYKVSTSYDDEPCNFLSANGLCRIHKVNYNLKPTYCKEFPYEDGRLSSHAKEICLLAKQKKDKIKKRAK
ncbi:MAG: YkgJ family cysteine cluster protein [Candidatus Omnitrophica bacterium]|nr:YkgJ family cysteine cluster protein [Candidatus Omnitrophota bacterium]